MVIVGGGPAGLFAAYTLASKAEVTILDFGRMPEKRTCPSQQTAFCTKCNPCNLTSGFGGAGLLSSGLLNLSDEIGFPQVTLDAIGRDNTRQLIEEADQIFLKHGAPKESFDPDDRFRVWERRAAEAGLKFVTAKQRLIGTDNAKPIILSIMEHLQKHKVKLQSSVRVKSVKPNTLSTNKGRYDFDFCLLAPGRSGMKWLANVMEQLKIKTRHAPVDVGLRIEVPATLMEGLCSIQRDPKILIHTRKYDDLVRTFCVNHNGYVVREQYETHACVNGHSFSNAQSGNTNFAFLVRVQLTKPVEDTTRYAESIAQQVTLLGGGKPIIQRLADLENHRRSTHERIASANIQPTLKDATPGDISMAFPKRLIDNILEGLQTLNKMIPGIYSGTTLLYAPEVKYSAMTVKTNRYFETPIEGLYVAGDGAGLSRGIIPAAVTGLWVAKHIHEKHL